MKTYSFHLEFTNGSNPYYHFPCDKRHHNAALKKWRKNYELKEISTYDSKEHVQSFFQAVPIIRTPQLSVFM